jgi:hypothetical protein
MPFVDGGLMLGRGSGDGSVKLIERDVGRHSLPSHSLRYHRRKGAGFKGCFTHQDAAVCMRNL